MLENINEVAVLVSTILAMAVGSIWYSPLLFGKHWMRALGLTEADLEISKQRMPKLFALAGLVNLIMLFVLAYFVAFAKEAGEALSTIALLLSILLAAATASAVIWEQKSLTYLYINVGYATVVVFGGMSVMWYWPW